MPTPKSKIKLFAKAATFLFTISFFIYIIDIKESVAIFKKTNISQLFFPLGLMCLAVVCQALRWKTLCPSIKITLWKYTFFVWIGNFYNTILPSSYGGDIVKSILFGKKYGNLQETFVNIGLMRIIGLLFQWFFCLFGIVLYWDQIKIFLNDNIQLSRFHFLITLFAIIITFTLLIKFRHKLFKLTLFDIIKTKVSSYKRFLLSILITFIIQVLNILITFLFFRAANCPIEFHEVFFFSPIISTLSILPTNIGGVGLPSLAVLYLYSTVSGYSPESVTAALALTMIISISFNMIGGVWLLFRQIKPRLFTKENQTT